MILAKLKEATRDQHDALENVVDVMNQTFSNDDYVRLLTRFYRFYSAIEGKLPESELKEAGFDLSRRWKTPLIERDLEHLGKLSEVKDEPKIVDIPDVASVPRAFGAIYVMEGATLGGQVITRHLRDRLGLSPEAGGAFFNSYGHEVGPMWKEFGAVITAYAEAGDHDETIVGAARDTFDSFRNVFSHDASKISIANS